MAWRSRLEGGIVHQEAYRQPNLPFPQAARLVRTSLLTLLAWGGLQLEAT